jgi:teichoic acid transport system permease protein
VWLYASPVLYYASEVPHHWTWLLWINPLGALLTAWSAVLHGGHAPATWAILVGTAWSVVIFVGATLFFMSREREFAVRL